MPNSVYALILAEDVQAGVFLYRALVAQGVAGRDIRQVIAPHGAGSGEQFVRERYPIEVRAHRSRSARRAAALLVHTDADILTVVQREQTLAQVLAAAAEPPRAPGEAIALLIPKRNIETWIEFGSSGAPVDELRVYPKRLGRPSDCGPAALAFAEDARHGSPRLDAPPAWRQGVEELRRVR